MNFKDTKSIDHFKSIFPKEKTKKGQKIKKESDTRKSVLLFDTSIIKTTSNRETDFKFAALFLFGLLGY